MQQATLLFWNQELRRAAPGNPYASAQSDITTLKDGKPYLSIGHHSVDPRSGVSLIPCTGFAPVVDKSDKTTAALMESQSKRLSGVSQTSAAHTILTDRAALGIGKILDQDYPPLSTV